MYASLAVDIYHPTQGYGSGLRISKHVILTAYHVLAGTGHAPPASGYQVRLLTDMLPQNGRLAEPSRYSARVLAEALWPEQDLALLEFDTGAAKELPPWNPCHAISWGAVAQDRLGTRLRVVGVGFPQAAADGDRRQSYDLDAILRPLTMPRDATMVLQVRSPGIEPASRWRGMSGAAVFAGGRLIGVVQATTDAFDKAALFFRPTAPLFRSPRFRDLLGVSEEDLAAIGLPTAPTLTKAFVGPTDEERAVLRRGAFKALAGAPSSGPGHKQLVGIYHRSFQHPEHVRDVEGLAGMIDVLCGAPSEPGGIPAERAGRRFGLPSAHAWVEGVAEDRAALGALRATLDAEPGANAPARLVASIPYPGEGVLRTLLYLPGRSEPDVTEDTCPDTEPEIRTILRSAVHRAESLADNLVVEVYVPHDILGRADPDACPLSYLGLKEQPLGTQYPVVLRWRERGEGQPGTKPARWRKVADEVRQAMNGANVMEPLGWIRANADPRMLSNNVHEALRDRTTNDPPRCPTAIAFAFVPTQGSDKRTHQILSGALLGGLAFGLWLRRKPPDWTLFGDTVNKALLGRQDSEAFLGRSRQLRSCATTENLRFAKWLSVFWDDPATNVLNDRWTAPETLQ
jgi:hypothetical protein